MKAKKPGLRVETTYKVYGRSYTTLDKALRSAAEIMANHLNNFEFDAGPENCKHLGSVERMTESWSRKKEDEWLDRVAAKALRRLRRLYG